MRARCMNVRGHIKLAELLVERIPVAVAESGRLGAAVLIGIRIEQAAFESELFDTSLQLRENPLDGLSRRLRQARDADEQAWKQLGLPVDDVVRLFGEPMHHLAWLRAVHHLEWTRREQ